MYSTDPWYHTEICTLSQTDYYMYMYMYVPLIKFIRSKEYAGDYEKKRVEMNKAQEETTISYQKKKVYSSFMQVPDLIFLLFCDVHLCTCTL